ncbi:hypothetical protein CesoFtcFv8_023136 [Champsocephalus esox]|uniref:Uncharacterized protein n=1 Tax=Champsocephalus esox TaxID=159716 RepID=A0AAN8B7L6_9TELE|nr:hypothetical protein CesoFtcFv8_023136 [Champsocephalus esox]
MKVFRNRQMTAKGKGIVGIAARRDPFFSLTSTTTPPPAVEGPCYGFGPKMVPGLDTPSSFFLCHFSPSLCFMSK